MEKSPLEKVTALLKAFENPAQEQAGINASDQAITPYHERSSWESYLRSNLGTASVRPVRAFSDGSYVVVHSEYKGGTTYAAFDVFKFENDEITGHWNNVQVQAELNPSGHSMLDGVSEISGEYKTAVTRELAKNIVDDILVNGKMEKLAGYFDGDNYLQHNPWFADQVSGLVNALTEWAKAGMTMVYSKIHKVLGQGNFALVISEGHLNGVHSAFYDLFRVENGVIAEHWDTIQEIKAADKDKFSGLDGF